MKIAFNPSTVAALIAPPNNKDITFDLRGQNIFARGVKFCGTDTNTWRDIKINNVSIDSNILDLRDGDNTTLTNINGVVTINSTWRPVVDNLTSDSTTSSLSANLGRILAGLINSKSDSEHNHDDRYLKLTGGTISGRLLVNSNSNSYTTPSIAINYYDSYTVNDYSITQIKMGNPKYDMYLGLSPTVKGYYGKIGYFMHANTDCEFLWGTSGWIKRMALECSSGNLWVSGSITASSFIGNASTATNADTVDGEHASNFSYTHQSSFDFSKIKSGRIVTFDQSDTDYGWINGFASTHNNYLTSVIFNTHRTSNWYVGYIEGSYATGLTNGLLAVHKLAFVDLIPTSLKNPYALTISLNGTSQGPYDGSAAKSINITPSSIGAATSDHNHDGRYVYNYGDTANVNGLALNQNALFMSTTSGITEDWWHILQAAWNNEYRWNSLIAFPTLNRNGMYYRSGLDDNTAWGVWVKLLDVNNYSSTLDSRYYTESEVNSLLDAKLNRQNLSYGTWNPRGYNLAADYNYNGGDLSISESGGQIHVSVDGYFWLNEGQYRVLDTSDIGGIQGSITILLYLSNSDTNWYPLIWGGNDHRNTYTSTGGIYKSHDVLSWLTSSLTLYATNLYTGRLETINNHYYRFDSDSTLRIYANSGGNSERIYFLAGIDNRIDDYDIPSYGGELRHSIILNPRGGFVGIGDTNPISKLTVAGSITPTVANVYNIGTSGNFYNTIYSRVLCGETTSTSIYHLIAIGYPGHDRIDFDEYGGAFYFNKTSSSSRHTIATITLGGLFTTDTITYGFNGLLYFNQSTGTTSGATNNANPYNDWFHIIRMNHNNANGYFVDLATAFHLDAMYFRRIVSGQDNGWRKILHDGNSYVTGGKGIINGTTITQVDNATNADKVDNYHIADESRQVYRNYYTVDSPAGAWILIKFPAWNGYNEIVTISGYGDNRHAHCVVYCGSRYQGIWGYQSNYNCLVVSKIRWKEVDSGKFALVALIDEGITTLVVRATNSLEISKTTEDNAAFAISASFFSSSGVFHGNVDWDKIIGKPSSFTPSEHTHPYLPLSGGTLTGALTIDFNHSGGGTTSSLLNVLFNGTHDYGIVAKFHSYGGDSPAIRFSHSSNKNEYNSLVNTNWSVGMRYNTYTDFAITQNRGTSGWGTVRFTINDSGNVGIGIDSASYKLHVVGDIYTTTGFKKNGSSDSYVLLGGGGHKLESSLRVEYASSAGNADTVDGEHASNFVRAGVYDSADLNELDTYSFIKSVNSNNKDTSPKGNTGWYNVILAVHRNGGGDGPGYIGQIALGMTTNTDDMFFRGRRTDSWKTVIHSGNIGSQTVASATKLQTPRTIWGQSFDGTRDVNGTIYINNSDSSNGAIRLNNNVNSNARISAISDQVIFNTGNAIRFGETSWDWNQWAGLKYTHSNKTIYLGIADGSVFNANSTLGGGTLNLRAGISNIDLNSGTSIIGRPTNGSPYSSRVTLNDTSIYLSAYGGISMSTGPGTIELSSGYGGIELSCLGNNASISPEGFKVEASRGAYLNSGNSGNVYLCLGGGNVGIGTNTPAYKLDVIGNIRATGQIIREGSGLTWVNGRNGALLRETSVAGYHTLWSLKTTNGSWDFGEYNAGSDWNNIPVLSYITDSNYNSGNNTPTYQIRFPLASGTVALTSNIPNPTNYYWANVKISASSSTTTSPTVHTLTATRVCAGHNPGIDNSISCSNWFRSSGDTGWYNTTYSGGWYMSDTSWIRAHNNVGIYTGGQIYSSNSIRMSNILLEHTDEINNITNGNIYLNYRNSGNVSLCYGGGKVGIGTATPLYELDVMGNTFTAGFGIRPYYLSDSRLLPTISPGDGYTYRCLEIGKSVAVSCIIADRVVLSNERGVLIKFNTGFDGLIVLLKDLENYGNGNGYFWVMPSGCKIIRPDGSSILINLNLISNAYDDGKSRFFVYSSKYNRWIEFYCG